MSPLQIHNTLTRKKEPFVPLAPGKAGLYVCGPTVYDYFHIGNARTFSVFDLVVRWLRATGYEVSYVRNITDIDDKIMDRARDKGEPMEALTERMVEAFNQDTARLGLLRPDLEPRATRYIAYCMAPTTVSSSSSGPARYTTSRPRTSMQASCSI